MDFYKGYDEFIEFAAGTDVNPFGAEMLAICQSRFEDLPTAVYELTEGLSDLGFDVDEDGVIGLMTGDILPSEELVEAIAGLAEDEVGIARLANSAGAAYDRAAEMLEAGEVELEEEDEEAEAELEDEDEDDVEYYYEDEDEEAVEEPEEDLAVALYSRQVVEDALNDLSSVADQMMFSDSRGLMTPHIKELLFGRNDKNRYMNFSSVCENEGYSPEEYLKCIEFSLNLLSELGGVDSVYFSTHVDDQPAEDNSIAFSARTNSSYGDERVIEEQASEMIDLLNL